MKAVLVFLSFLLTTSLFSQRQIGEDIDGEAAWDHSGGAVDLSANGMIVAIGATGNKDNGYAAGHVRVFQYNGTAWIQKGQDIDGDRSSDNLGRAVALSSDGNILAVGAPYNGSLGTYTGYARVFQFDGTNWVQMGQDIVGEAIDDSFGRALDLSSDGQIIALGTPYNDENGFRSGHARMLQFDGSNWVQMGQDIDGEAVEDRSGYSVSLSGDGSRVAIGAIDHDASASNAGQVRIFQYDGTNWVQIGDIDGEATEDHLGYSVALSTDGNHLVAGGPFNDGDGTALSSGHVRVYSFDGTSWLQRGQDIDGEGPDDWFGASTAISDDGNAIIVGATHNDGNGIGSGQVRYFKYEGNKWIQIGIDIDGEAPDDRLGAALAISADGKTFAAGASANDGIILNSGHVRVYGMKGVYGKIFNDYDGDCVQNTFKGGLDNRYAIIQPGNRAVTTGNNGAWFIDSLPVGTYTISPDTSAPWITECPFFQTFTVIDPEDISCSPAIGLSSTHPCSAPDVSINMPFMRRCFSDQKIYVRACNTALASFSIDNAYVVVELDELLMVTSADLPYLNIGPNQYQFNLDTLLPNQCISIGINTTLNCDAQLGQAICVQAELFPVEECMLDSIPNPFPPTVDSCTTDWDRSSLSVIGYCQNDTVYFEITNTGDFGAGDMTCFSPVNIYVNDTLYLIDSVQVAGQEVFVYTFPANGESWHLQVSQHPLHPGNSNPRATVEDCGGLTGQTRINYFAMDDADPVIDLYCGEVTGSYDPNDKTGFPLGLTENHYIHPNQKIQYLVRFQNTGTDTAFTVVVRDTLDTNFDIYSIRPGVSSHDYDFRIYGPRVLEWTFNNIMLSDSTVNEPGSHGFLTFTVDQLPNLPDGTRLRNAVGIYFDFNDPIITNTTEHTILYPLQTGVVSSIEQHLGTSSDFILYPNPNNGLFTIDFGLFYNRAIISVFSLAGQVVTTQSYSQIQKTDLSISQPPGIYFVEVKVSGGGVRMFKVLKF